MKVLTLSSSEITLRDRLFFPGCVCSCCADNYRYLLNTRHAEFDNKVRLHDDTRHLSFKRFPSEPVVSIRIWLHGDLVFFVSSRPPKHQRECFYCSWASAVMRFEEHQSPSPSRSQRRSKKLDVKCKRPTALMKMSQLPQEEDGNREEDGFQNEFMDFISF